MGQKKLYYYIDVLGRTGQLLALAIVGGLLNRARGGWLNLSQETSTAQNILPHMMFGIITGSFVGMLGRRLKPGAVVAISTTFSLYVTWDAYVNVGRNEYTYLDSAGCFDWLLGRDENGFDFTRRWTREFTGMTLRGLLWTMPGGYLLYHMGFGWQYALSGAAMGLFYNFGWISDSTQYDFEYGPNYGDFLFGTWLYLSLFAMTMSQHKHLKKYAIFTGHPDRIEVGEGRDLYVTRDVEPHGREREKTKLESYMEGLFEICAVIFTLILLGSVFFYGTITPSDAGNQARTIIGLVVSIAILLGTQCTLFYNRIKRRLTGENSPLLPGGVVDDGAPKRNALCEWLWPKGGVPPYLQVRTLVGWVGVGTTIVGYVLMMVSLGWNIRTKRYNDDDTI